MLEEKISISVDSNMKDSGKVEETQMDLGTYDETIGFLDSYESDLEKMGIEVKTVINQIRIFDINDLRRISLLPKFLFHSAVLKLNSIIVDFFQQSTEESDAYTIASFLATLSRFSNDDPELYFPLMMISINYFMMNTQFAKSILHINHVYGLAMQSLVEMFKQSNDSPLLKDIKTMIHVLNSLQNMN